MIFKALFAAFVLVLGVGPTHAEGDLNNGGKLYRQYCTGCHGEDGRGGGHTFMPHVDRLTKKGYVDLLPDEYLVDVIAEGGKYYGKSSFMPSWKEALTIKEMQDIVAYIRTLPLH